MRNILAAILLLSASGIAYADIIDDNVAKAEKGLQNAQKRLEAARRCQQQREICLLEMKEKAVAAAERAAKKLADIQSAETAK